MKSKLENQQVSCETAYLNFGEIMNWSEYKNEPLILRRNVAHVWRICLTDYTDKADQMVGMISESELASSRRFVRKEDGARYLVAKAFQREVLSHYINIQPVMLDFHLAEHGKPYLKNTSIQFNLSHSGNYALLAVARDMEIGVDIERLRQNINATELVGRFFSENEKREFNQLDEKEKKTTFYKMWVKKEAFAKATGYGLSFPLSEFTVMVPDSLGDESVVVHNNKMVLFQWVVRLIEMPDMFEYYAAISANADICHLICKDYQFNEIKR